MRFINLSLHVLFPALVVAAMFVAGCDEAEPDTGAAGSAGSPAETGTAATPAPATQPIIPLAQMADWCPEHGVPESICTQCNESLVADFKAKGGWCEQHNVPDSQCFQCKPELRETFVVAYKEKYGKEPPAGGTDHD